MAPPDDTMVHLPMPQIIWCLRHAERIRSSVTSVKRTLRDYTHYITTTTGFSREVDEELMKAAKIGAPHEWQRCVILILDEMHIRENLVYDKHSGELIGFADLGDINRHLLAFERSVELRDKSSEPLASSVLVMMVRGLFTKLQFPYAQFPCANVTGDLLYDPFWEAVFRIERLGLKVSRLAFCFTINLVYILLFCIRCWHRRLMGPLSTGVW